MLNDTTGCNHQIAELVKHYRTNDPIFSTDKMQMEMGNVLGETIN